MLSTPIYFLVAAILALVAFAVGQIYPGAGMLFVAGATGGWAVYCARRQRRLKSKS